MAQNQVFRGTARTIVTDADGTKEYFYHSTAVVSILPHGSIRLDSGGWRTATTKLAMNQASAQARLGFTVYQRRHEWFVSYAGQELSFFDGMVL